MPDLAPLGPDDASVADKKKPRQLLLAGLFL
jgi:hypothetical protein